VRVEGSNPFARSKHFPRKIKHRMRKYLPHRVAVVGLGVPLGYQACTFAAQLSPSSVEARPASTCRQRGQVRHERHTLSVVPSSRVHSLVLKPADTTRCGRLRALGEVPLGSLGRVPAEDAVVGVERSLFVDATLIESRDARNGQQQLLCNSYARSAPVVAVGEVGEVQSVLDTADFDAALRHVGAAVPTPRIQQLDVPGCDERLKLPHGRREFNELVVRIPQDDFHGVAALVVHVVEFAAGRPARVLSYVAKPNGDATQLVPSHVGAT
jgi:hypothetical protein